MWFEVVCDLCSCFLYKSWFILTMLQFLFIINITNQKSIKDSTCYILRPTQSFKNFSKCENNHFKPHVLAIGILRKTHFVGFCFLYESGPIFFFWISVLPDTSMSNLSLLYTKVGVAKALNTCSDTQPALRHFCNTYKYVKFHISTISPCQKTYLGKASVGPPKAGLVYLSTKLNTVAQARIGLRFLSSKFLGFGHIPKTSWDKAFDILLTNLLYDRFDVCLR